MPAYFFHLAIELRPSPSPIDTPPHDQPVFSPRPDFDIFTYPLPVHRSSSWASSLAPRRAHRRAKTNIPGDKLVSTSGVHRGSSPPQRQSVDTEDLAAHQRQRWDLARFEPASRRPSFAHDKLASDCRFDKIAIESIDMAPAPTSLGTSGLEQTTDSSSDNSPLSIKGKYIPSDPKTTQVGWGVVHLYRDRLESQQLQDDNNLKSSQHLSDRDAASLADDEAYVDKDCTTLCILAVPAYMTPSDLLGWLGESTLEVVSHFRLVRTARSNRYMVLIKFRDAKKAKDWQKEWNGKVFNSMEPENCHVVFVKSIRFQPEQSKKDPSSFPDMSNDPFTPATNPVVASGDTVKTGSSLDAVKHAASLTPKPAPPPTPALVELPTCPVCLERMDETTGLTTIFCQHVFHCACLQKWQGSGCPVCRYTQNDPSHRSGSRNQETEDQCRVCGSLENLWICLVCGHVGCGRYDEAHAFAHFEQTSHSFAMDLTTQVIWDYIGDEYVHRLIQNKADGKLVELPSSTSQVPAREHAMPKEKLENMGLEYANLLKGQLDSQRSYFEEQVDRAVDKATQAGAAADEATATSIKATEQLQVLQSSYDVLLQETLPDLGRDKDRAERRAEKFETMARKMEKEWKEKEVINESLMDRISHLEKQLSEATLKNSDLEEQNRDLSFFISGMEKLKDQGTDVQEGTVQIGDSAANVKKKKGKGKK